MIEAVSKPTPKRSRKQKLLVLLFFLLAMGWLAIWMSGGFRREPLHKGRPISYWVDHACTLYTNDVLASRIEVQSIGPAAVPYLVDRLRVSEGWRKAWNSLRARLPKALQASIPEKRPANQIWTGAANTLAMLGPAAKPAVPDLVRLLPAIGSPAIQALGDIGPDAKEALPALQGLLASHKTAIPFRLAIARSLWQIGRETNLVLEICTNAMASANNNWTGPGVLINLGPAAAPAVPLALAALEDTNRPSAMRANSAIMLGVTRIDTPEIRAALLAGTQEGQDENLRCNCAMALWDLDPQYAPLATRMVMEKFARKPGVDDDFMAWLSFRGLDPRQSIPTLKQLAADDSGEMREVAKRTLEIIEKKSDTAAKQ